MGRFRFRSMDRRGQVCEGSVSAANVAALTEILRQQGQFLISATVQATPTAANTAAAAGAAGAPTAVKAGAPGTRAPKMGAARPVRDQEVVIFNSQFSLMTRSAVPLLEALTTLAQQQTNPVFRRVLEDITGAINGGSTLIAAFGRHPLVFDKVYLSLLEAGESSGTLPHMITRISEYLEFKVSIRARVKSALMYPSIVMGAAFLIVFLLLIFILPTFAEVFEQFDAKLPRATVMLLSLSAATRAYGLIWAAALCGVAFLVRQWAKAPRNRYFIDVLFLRTPVVGTLVRAVVLARVTRTLGELLGGGVPVLKAIELSEATAGNEVYSRMLRSMIEQVSAGNPLAWSLSACDDVPEMVAHLVASAEKTGRLPEALSFIADFYQRQIDVALHDLFGALEPLFVVFLGGTIGGIAITMLLPIFQLGGIVQ